MPVIKDNGDYKNIDIYLQDKNIVFNLTDIYTNNITFNAVDLFRAIEFLAKKGK